MISFFQRFVIIFAIFISFAVVASAELAQKYGILVVVPIIVVAIVGIAINLAYWLPKYRIR